MWHNNDWLDSAGSDDDFGCWQRRAAAHGTKQVAQASDLRRWDILGITARAVRNVNLVGAAILAAVHFGVFIALLSLWDLSLVIPLGALDYALVTIAARYLLGETVRPMRWAGVALIVAGVAMTSLT